MPVPFPHRRATFVPGKSPLSSSGESRERGRGEREEEGAGGGDQGERAGRERERKDEGEAEKAGPRPSLHRAAAPASASLPAAWGGDEVEGEKTGEPDGSPALVRARRRALMLAGSEPGWEAPPALGVASGGGPTGHGRLAGPLQPTQWSVAAGEEEGGRRRGRERERKKGGEEEGRRARRRCGVFWRPASWPERRRWRPTSRRHGYGSRAGPRPCGLGRAGSGRGPSLGPIFGAQSRSGPTKRGWSPNLL